jgi:hypothetical protein
MSWNPVPGNVYISFMMSWNPVPGNPFSIRWWRYRIYYPSALSPDIRTISWRSINRYPFSADFNPYLAN